jgi:chitin disaccharide deacetylase
MSVNPAVRALGYDDDARLVIFHADDIGMCQASIDAYADLVDFGLITSAAVMIPCPWFPAAAAYCRDHPSVDMGVHLTLTCEWDHYRWGPVSTRDPASGLLDDEGYFHRTNEAVWQQADPAAIRREIEAQLKQALAAGIDVTHIDTHMGTIANPAYISHYVALGMEYRLPLLSLRQDEAALAAHGMSQESITAVMQLQRELERIGVPLIDQHYGMPLENVAADRVGQVKAALKSLPPGITHFIIHPARDTSELRAITPDYWRGRVADYHAFMSDELAQFIRDEGLHPIGYRTLRDLLRN